MRGRPFVSAPLLTSMSMWSLVFLCFVVATLYLKGIFNYRYLVHDTNVLYKS